MAKFPYPPSPANVPEGLTDFPPSYTSRQWVLVVSLFLFLAVYVGLVVLSGAATVLFVMLIPFLSCFAIVGALVSAVTCLLLVKGLFKHQEEDKDLHIEITEDEHPKLFGFIHRLCEEVGVGEPSRVFVSPDVNAAVIYRTSLINVIVPPEQDLLIGLGLVNALNLSEFKATLAHEFGHFSQGGWISAYFHVVLRICADIVTGRDWFDRAIDGMKQVGGWPGILGYTISGGLGVLRWSLDKTFGLIAFQRHSVLREREFHADLVAASVAGSNAITHALYRLGFASETFGQALEDLHKAADHKLFSADMYYHQAAAADLIRRKKRDPRLGKPPVLDDPRDGKKVQVFDPEKDEDPGDEGDYHPANFDREENVKERFVPAVEDARSAWVLFDEPAELRERLTYKVYRAGKKIPRNADLTDPQVVQKFIDDEHAETTYDPRYAGAYDDRLIHPGDMVELTRLISSDPWEDARLVEVHARLYTDIRAKTEERKELIEELDRIRSESEGAKSKRLRRIVDDLEDKLETADRWFDGLDRRAFLVFSQMAWRTDPADYHDLVNRYKFHIAVQDIFHITRKHKQKAHFYAVVLMALEQSDPDYFAETMHVLRSARKALRQALRDADEIDMPAMKNFVAGESLGMFLLDKELVKEFPEDYVKGKQIVKLLEQLDAVQSRASRLVAKSLGGILALHEKAAAAFLANRKPAVVARARPVPPPPQ